MKAEFLGPSTALPPRFDAEVVNDKKSAARQAHAHQTAEIVNSTMADHPREIFMRGVRAAFSNHRLSWEEAWNQCMTETHKTAYDTWMAECDKSKAKPSFTNARTNARTNAGTEARPPVGSQEYRRAIYERQMAVADFVNEIMVEKPFLTYEQAYSKAEKERPELFSQMQQPQRREFTNLQDNFQPQRDHHKGRTIDAAAQTDAFNEMLSSMPMPGEPGHTEWRSKIRGRQTEVSGHQARLLFNSVVQSLAEEGDLQWSEAFKRCEKEFAALKAQIKVLPESTY
ncbi:MAG: hypothetical protein QOF48_1520 [Verrucomicrobiota bacterium]|jgi:hypothetical protein